MRGKYPRANDPLVQKFRGQTDLGVALAAPDLQACIG